MANWLRNRPFITPARPADLFSPSCGKTSVASSSLATTVTRMELQYSEPAFIAVAFQYS